MLYPPERWVLSWHFPFVSGNQLAHEEKDILKSSPPSLVARLMGLDGFPSQQLISRQKNHSANKNFSVEDRACKKSSVEKKAQFKDVFEDRVERPSSNQDLVVELLQQPDSLFVKHMRSVQGSPSGSLCNHVTGVNPPSQPSKCESKAKGWKAEREASVQHDNISKKINGDQLLSHAYHNHTSLSSLKPSKGHADGKDETNIITTRIVVLKPNYAKARSARSSFSSPDSSHTDSYDGWNDKEYMNDEGYLGKIDFSKDREFSRSECRDARQSAKRTAREIRETSGSMLSAREARDAAKKFNREVQEVFDRMIADYPACVKNLPGSGGRHDFSSIDYASESVMRKMTSCDSTESFVSRNAKKRILERWKLAQRYHDVGVGGKGSTLGEMLSIPDSDMRNLDAVTNIDRTRDAFDMQKGAKWDGPLGISSRDGWKDKCSKLSQRSRSLPPLSTSNRTERLNAEQESRVDDKLLMPREARSEGRSKTLAGNFSEKENLSSKKSRSSRRKSLSSRRRYTCDTNITLESYTQDQMDVDLEKKNPPEDQSIAPHTPSFFSTVDSPMSTKHESKNFSAVSSNESLSELSACMLKYCDSSAVDQEDSNPQV